MHAFGTASFNSSFHGRGRFILNRKAQWSKPCIATIIGLFRIIHQLALYVSYSHVTSKRTLCNVYSQKFHSHFYFTIIACTDCIYFITLWWCIYFPQCFLFYRTNIPAKAYCLFSEILENIKIEMKWNRRLKVTKQISSITCTSTHAITLAICSKYS